MITIRNAREDEVDAVSDIGLRAWEGAMALVGDADDMRERAHAAFRDFARSSWLTITLVELNGQPVGWGAREQLDELITDFWIDPPFQRQGLGQRLLAQIESDILRQGLDAARLETHAQNKHALSFFQKSGYRVSWLSVAYSPKIDRDVQSVGLQKQLTHLAGTGYGHEF
jgi:ribosomal-protein-alanine N-acetyltransferase